MTTNYDMIINDKEKLCQLLSLNEFFVSEIINKWWCKKRCQFVNICDEDCLDDTSAFDIVMVWLDEPDLSEQVQEGPQNHMKNKEKRAEKLAKDVLDFVNVMGFDMDTFAETISRGHKTLQQSTMQLFITTIRKMAEVTPDDRNAAAVDLAKRITEIADECALPLI